MSTGKKLHEDVQALVDYAIDKSIEPYDQRKITEDFFDTPCVFAELDEYDARAVMDGFNKKGHTHWINRATGQTDLTETNPDPPHPKKVYDADEESFIEISDQQRAQAMSMQRALDASTLVTAIIMKRMSDEKLYLAVDNGYSSFKEYAEVRCPFGYRQAQKYAAIGRKFAPLVPGQNGQGELSSPHQIEGNGVFEDLGELGVNKLYELSKIEDADFTDLSEGKVILKDGTELDLEEIKQQSAQAFKKQMDEHRRYIEQQEKELDKAIQDKEKAIKEKEKIEEQAETGLRYENMFAKAHGSYQVNKQRLADARSRALDLNQVISKLKDVPAEFDSLCDDIRDLHKIIHRGLTNLRDSNQEAFLNEGIDDKEA